MQEKQKIRIWWFTLMLITVFNILSGQQYGPLLPGDSGESVQLISDRDLYCITESIHFTAYVQQTPELKNTEWSKILYLELITWKGTKLAQAKFTVKNGMCSASLQIPGNVKSGSYYLRAYTNWMKNYSPHLYGYLPVKIVNPFVKECDKGPKESVLSAQKKAGAAFNETDLFILGGLKPSYGIREEVVVDLACDKKAYSGSLIMYVGRQNQKPGPYSSFTFIDSSQENSGDVIRYLPEIKRQSLSGKALYKKNMTPLSNEKIVLSSAVDPFYFSCISTDSLGYFCFSLPEYKGAYQFCLTTAENLTDETEFLINNDYCNQPIILPYTAFELSPEEEQIAMEICTNTQLKNRYSQNNPVEKNHEHLPFYGKAQRVIYIKDYIELSNLEEFLFELVSDVKIVRNNKEPQIMLEEKSSLATYPPLILFDNIPVPNNKELLKLSNKQIERIEIINGGYIIGDNMYSGIICIYSNQQDFAGMGLRKNMQFFNFSLLSENEASFPDYSNDSDTRLANLSNLLYWNATVSPKDGKPTELSFFTGDASGTYVVTICGFSKDSHSWLYKQYPFTVK